jgi:hypothetical protein
MNINELKYLISVKLRHHKSVEGVRLKIVFLVLKMNSKIFFLA